MENSNFQIINPTLCPGHKYFHQSVEIPSVSLLMAQIWPETIVAEEYVDRPAIDWGNRFHEFAVDYFLDGGAGWPAPFVAWMDYVSDELGLNGAEVATEVAVGIKGGYAGTVDAMDMCDTTLRVFDWKTGLETKSHRKQLLAYAGIMCATNPRIVKIELINVYFNRKDTTATPVIKRHGATVSDAVRMVRLMLAARSVWALKPSF